MVRLGNIWKSCCLLLFFSVETTNPEPASDSEVSDNDVEKLTLVSQRVQQAALNLFIEAAKVGFFKCFLLQP